MGSHRWCWLGSLPGSRAGGWRVPYRSLDGTQSQTSVMTPQCQRQLRGKRGSEEDPGPNRAEIQQTVSSTVREPAATRHTMSYDSHRGQQLRTQKVALIETHMQIPGTGSFPIPPGHLGEKETRWIMLTGCLPGRDHF